MIKGIGLVVFFVLLSYNVEAGYVYVGTEADVLYLGHFNTTSGSLCLVASTETQFPSCIFTHLFILFLLFLFLLWTFCFLNYIVLALHPSKQFLYSTNEVEDFQGVSNSGIFILLVPRFVLFNCFFLCSFEFSFHYEVCQITRLIKISKVE
jgi:hypothetical protein